MYSALDIASYFITTYGKDSDISPMKLTKLVYISHGWHLGIIGTPLINDEIEAWKYGPVIPTIYHTYKRYGGAVITSSGMPISERLNNDAVTKELLDRVWEEYGSCSAVELSAMTHQVGTPWYNTFYNKSNGNLYQYPSPSQISDDVIKEHYEGLYEKSEQQQ